MRTITLVLAIAVALAGCATYNSTYWRHPATGVMVECQASWKEISYYELDLPTRMRTYCEALMRQAGLEQISRDEGKQWEKGQAATPTPAATPSADCPGNTFWNGKGCTSQ